MTLPMVDLLRIGMAVYVTDRLMRRKRRDQQRHWSRSLMLKIGVLEPDIWNTDDIRDSLIDSLEFLTDDTWNISFEQDDRRERRELQRRLFPFFPQTRLCLYSGGLDSAAGLGNQLLAEPQRSAIPITIWHQGGQRFIVQRQIELMRKHCNDTDLNPLIFKAHLLQKAKKYGKEEPTQRSRAFLFMAAGAATALMCGCSEVEVYESGIGAINLPLLAKRIKATVALLTDPDLNDLEELRVTLVDLKTRRIALESRQSHVTRRIGQAYEEGELREWAASRFERLAEEFDPRNITLEFRLVVQSFVDRIEIDPKAGKRGYLYLPTNVLECLRKETSTQIAQGDQREGPEPENA